MAALSRLLWGACALGLVLAASGALEPPAPAVPRTLDEALGTPETAAARDAADRRRAGAVEALTLACMHGKGLAYTPLVEVQPAIPDAGLDPAAWAAKWGFGVTTSVDAVAGSSDADPNVERMRTMTDDARADYVQALEGGPEAPGCRTTAHTQVDGLRDRLLAPLATARATMQAAIDADPRSVALQAAWRSCIEDLGIDAADRRAILPRLVGSFATRLQAILATPGRPGLTALQDEERRVAVAVVACEGALIDGLAAVSKGYEAAFVTGHRVELERIRVALVAAEDAWPSGPP